MVTKDCYVERALERLTVTTMKLCRDSAPAAFGEKTRFGGSFLCFGARRFRCNRETLFTLPWPCSWSVSQMIGWFTLPLDGQSCGLPIAVREAHVAYHVGGWRRSRLGVAGNNAPPSTLRHQRSRVIRVTVGGNREIHVESTAEIALSCAP